jgi:hypothetical protein
MAEATNQGAMKNGSKLHFSPFKNPFNLIAPKMVHVNH